MDLIRALTQNHARLDTQSADPLLRPLELPGEPDEVANQIHRWAQQQPSWSFVSRYDSESSIELCLTRRTRLLRFVDDIRIQIKRNGNGSRLEAESQSRVGKGDLGQNSRNLKELTDQFRRGQ